MKRNESWVDIKGYEGLYQVSNYGRVKSFHKKNIGLIMSPYSTRKGYSRIGLRKDLITTKYLVHRLVAENFIPNPYNYSQVNHKDENGYNNQVDNLEWCNNQYNVNYGTANKRRGETAYKPVNQYTLNMQFIKKFDSITSATKEGFNSGGISMCCKGNYKHHHGYIWRYADD